VKDNKAIISISVYKINYPIKGISYSNEKPIRKLRINGTFTEKELPDMTRLRRHAPCTCMLHKTLTRTEKDYFNFIKKANDRVGRDIRTIDMNTCG